MCVAIFAFYAAETYSIKIIIAHFLQYLCVVLGDIRKIKTVQYYHKIPRYDGIVIVTKF